MKLSSQALSSFREIYLQRFQTELNYEDAHELALLLLNFFKRIYKPIPKKDSQVLPERLPMYEL